MKQIPARESIGLLRAMTWVLCAVGILALAFTTVNVTRFATSRNVPLPIAILLDPMLGTALAGVLYVDARLASWGINPPAWSTTLRWGAGCTAALMNSWESLWPDGQIGWPRRADPAAVLLHLTPALLLIALTETIAAYRRTVTDLMSRFATADPPEQHTLPSLSAPRSLQEGTDPRTSHSDPPTALPPDRAGPEPASISTPAATDTGHDRPHTADDTPHHPLLGPKPPPANDTATDADVWPRAVALHEAARAATGNPVSIWRLRTDLRIGPRRARRIRERLLARDRNPPPSTN
ncbi:extensin [Streptomyces sp. ISL-22]|uniref:extensin n=1 Tax=unclassified Streptomyces TaxID=2593676 RepID=UPI001BE572E3|nr:MULTISPECIES: extensin [unclassified Streptomyces]MBT2418076.1 extensin [Streptomyces sp. ISL-24]MBT2432249.1 extensin [Streptomyces sp. ISL-22]